MAPPNRRALGSIWRLGRRISRPSIPLISRLPCRNLETAANKSEPVDVFASIPQANPSSIPFSEASSGDSQLEDLSQQGIETTQGTPARHPRAVQIAYLRPLKRTPKYGIPSCNLQLRSYSVRNLEMFATFALRAAYFLKLPAVGPVPLPKQIQRWTVPRGHFVHKKSQENFERITLRRLIQIQDGHPETIQIWLAYLRKRAYFGIGMKANVWAFEKLGIGREMDAVKTNEDDIEEQLASKFPNQLTPEVQAEVDKWMAEHDANTKYAGAGPPRSEVDAQVEEPNEAASSQLSMFDQVENGPVLSQSPNEYDEMALHKAQFAVKIYDTVKKHGEDGARVELFETIQENLDATRILDAVASDHKDLDVETVKIHLNIAIDQFADKHSREMYTMTLQDTHTVPVETPSQEAYGLQHMETATSLLQSDIASSISFLGNETLEENILTAVDKELQIIWAEHGKKHNLGNAQHNQQMNDNSAEGSSSATSMANSDEVESTADIQITTPQLDDLSLELANSLDQVEVMVKKAENLLKNIRPAQTDGQADTQQEPSTTPIQAPKREEPAAAVETAQTSDNQVEFPSNTSDVAQVSKTTNASAEQEIAVEESVNHREKVEARPAKEDTKPPAPADIDTTKDISTPEEADPSIEPTTEQAKEAEEEDAKQPLGNLPKTPS